MRETCSFFLCTSDEKRETSIGGLNRGALRRKEIVRALRQPSLTRPETPSTFRPYESIGSPEALSQLSQAIELEVTTFTDAST